MHAADVEMSLHNRSRSSKGDEPGAACNVPMSGTIRLEDMEPLLGFIGNTEIVEMSIRLPGREIASLIRALRAQTRRDPLSIALQLSNDSGLVVCVGDTGAPPFDTATPINKLSSPFLPGVDVRANAATGGAKQIHVGDMTLNPSHHEVKVKGRICAGLTPMEYEILHLLARNAGMLFSRNDILAAMQSDNRAISNRSVDIHIYGIRKKIGAAASYVQTVRGYGYRVCA